MTVEAGSPWSWPVPVREDLIGRIHATPTQAVVAVTGGGSAALPWLLGVPGASRTILDGLIPYAGAALGELLGEAPEQAVSPATAVAMARACLTRAQRFAGDATVPVVGVAATAALVSDRPKRGAHRAHVAVARLDPAAAHHAPGPDEHVWSLTLSKGARNRVEEDEVVSTLVIAALAHAAGVSAGCPPSLLLDGDVLDAGWPGDAP